MAVKKKLSIIYLLILSCMFSSYAAVRKDHQTGTKVFVFYPAKSNFQAKQASLAIIREPETKGVILKNAGKKVRFYSKDGKSCASISVEPGTSLYGTGENTGSLMRNGKKVTLWNTDNVQYKAYNGDRLYQSHPWVLGVNKDGTAFGVLADNTWKQQIDLTDSIRFISDGPAFRVIIIKGNSPQDVVKELATLIGRMEMPPLWALGYQQCRWSYIPDTRIKNVADTFRLKKIPCDVIWMDIDYMDSFRIFTFDKVKMPHPEAVNNYLHQKGFHSIWMIDPGVKAEKGYSVYDSGSKGDNWVENSDRKEFNGKVWPGKCAFPDFTRPETRAWWSGLYKDFIATGIDGVWNDMNEPSVFDSPTKTMPVDNWHRGGDGLQAGNHLQYHNVYGMLMVRATREGILNANPGKRPFVLSRAGYLGSNRYAATWTGDNSATVEDMKLSIPMSLNLSLSGQAFNGPDIGGFSMNTTPDLFGQWISMGVFFPFVRGHACIGTNNKEPWAFGSEIEDVSRTAINRRYRLLPYYYTLFHESSVTGMPVMRPVFFADPQDKALRTEEQTFLVGNDLLIIPKWAVSPVQPKGIWRIISIAGENSLTDKYQADVKIKGGAIIPMGNIIQNTTQYSLDSLTLFVSLDQKGEANGTLYEDAGDGFQYKNGEFLMTGYRAIQTGTSVKVTVSITEGNLKSTNRNYKICVVTDNGTFESKWTTGNSILVDLKK
jgi:alpha-glucosidase